MHGYVHTFTDNFCSYAMELHKQYIHIQAFSPIHKPTDFYKKLESAKENVCVIDALLLEGGGTEFGNMLLLSMGEAVGVAAEMALSVILG